MSMHRCQLCDASYSTAVELSRHNENTGHSREIEIRASERATVEAEIVAWLRDVAAVGAHNDDHCSGRIEEIADAIERGEHRKGGAL